MENNNQIRNVVLFVVSDLVRNHAFGTPSGGKWTFQAPIAGLGDAGKREFNSADELTAYIADAYVRQIGTTGALRAAS
jgi:hypothetical protein